MEHSMDLIQFYGNHLTDEVSPCNYEPKVLVLFILDGSSSMRGKGICELNRGLKEFDSFFMNNEVAMAKLQVGIVTFASDIKVIRKFSPLGNPPFPELTAVGRTLMVEGIKAGYTLMDNEINYYKHRGLPPRQAFTILIADGSPWPDKKLGNIPEIIDVGFREKKIIFQAFGAGNANFKVLNQLSTPEFPPQRIRGYNFENLLRWLIPSISIYLSGMKRLEYKPSY